MHYLLAIYGEESAEEAIPPEQMDDYMQGWFKFDEQIRNAVNVVSGSALQPTSTATTIRQKDGKVVTLDGPFAETKEQLGGYYLIEVENLDDAIHWAKKMPNLSHGGSVEVRALQVFEE